MRQEFDYAGLEGRLLSSSYAPGPGHPKHEPMLTGIAANLSRRTPRAGRVSVRLQDAIVLWTAEVGVNH